MVKNNNIKIGKNGFTLAEMLVSMLVVSVLFAVSTKLLTHKPPVQTVTNPHGFFECYYKEGELYTHSMKGQAEVEPKPAKNCNFEPQLGLAFINIHYYDPHISEDEKSYFNSQEPLIDSNFEFTNPASIAHYYPNCFTLSGDGVDAVSEPKIDDVTRKYFKSHNVFLEYLKLAHPKSEIYKEWANKNPERASGTAEEYTETGVPIYPDEVPINDRVLFISW